MKQKSFILPNGQHLIVKVIHGTYMAFYSGDNFQRFGLTEGRSIDIIANEIIKEIESKVQEK